MRYNHFLVILALYKIQKINQNMIKRFSCYQHNFKR